ncbi:MAG: hypothetical protein ABIX28_16485 [Vicinamibacterales bacterium]
MLSPSGRRLAIVLSAILGACVLAVSLGPDARAVAGSLPDGLPNAAFWALSDELSEPNGYFQSDNLVSNEIQFQQVIRELEKTARPNRVYLGVGPEQNFTYISVLKPAMVFIVDVRRGNLQLHLMYKAIFELSADRADFVSKLFSKKRPAGLTADSSAAEIFGAYEKVETSEAFYKENLAAIADQLVTTRGLRLSDEDLKGIEYVYYQFFWYGPSIQYWSTGGSGRGGRNAPTFADLMMADDGTGVARSFLSSDATYRVLKNLETRNLVVPVVGNFAGPTALRRVGAYAREHDASIAAFYLSNVEQYLGRSGTWGQFCANVATMPLDESSTFIRSVRSGNFIPGVGLDSELGSMATETKACSLSGAARLLFRQGPLNRPSYAQPPASSRR